MEVTVNKYFVLEPKHDIGKGKLTERLLAQGILTPNMLQELKKEWNRPPPRSKYSRDDTRPTYSDRDDPKYKNNTRDDAKYNNYRREDSIYTNNSLCNSVKYGSGEEIDSKRYSSREDYANWDDQNKSVTRRLTRKKKP